MTKDSGKLWEGKGEYILPSDVRVADGDFGDLGIWPKRKVSTRANLSMF